MIKKYKIYIELLILGILFIIFAVMPILPNIFGRFQLFLISDQFNNFCLSIGTGFMASSIVAALGEYKNDKRKQHEDILYKNVLLLELNTQVDDFFSDIDYEVFINQILNSDNLNVAFKECRRVQYIGGVIFNDRELSALESINSSLKQLTVVIHKYDVLNLSHKYKDLFYDSLLKNWTVIMDNHNRYRINKHVGPIPKDDAIAIEFFRIACEVLQGSLNKYEEIFKLKKQNE